MEEVSRLNTDILSARSAELLRRLLTYEMKMADGTAPVGATVSVQAVESEPTHAEEDISSIYIPYFGLIKIVCGGENCKEWPRTTEDQPERTHQHSILRSSSLTYVQAARLHETGGSSSVTNSPWSPDTEPMRPINCGSLGPEPMLRSSDTQFAHAPELAPQFPGILQHDYQYPELIAGAEDWAFQGVDLAFFDSLMSGVGEVNEETEWTKW